MRTYMGKRNKWALQSPGRRRTTFSFCECVGVGSDGIIVVFPTRPTEKAAPEHPESKRENSKEIPKKEELETPLKIAGSLSGTGLQIEFCCERETGGVVERDFVFSFCF